MPSDCCYFVDKAAAAGAAPALYYFGSILHCFAVFTQNLGQTLCLMGLLAFHFVYALSDSAKKSLNVTPSATQIRSIVGTPN